jgi:hypothetical protein
LPHLGGIGLLRDKRTKIIITIFVLVIFLLGGAAGYFVVTLFGNDNERQVKQEPVNDGPYIYWKDTGHAVVFYVCEGDLLTAEFQAPDTIRFEGLCSDSATAYKIPIKAPSVEAEYFENVPRIFAVSDIHGEYDYFVDILRNGGVIDNRNGWIFGDGHLLIAGDVGNR